MLLLAERKNHFKPYITRYKKSVGDDEDMLGGGQSI